MLEKNSTLRSKRHYFDIKTNSDIILATVLKLFELNAVSWPSLVNSEMQVDPFSMSCIIHCGCVWMMYGSAEWKVKLINLWKHTSLAKGLIKWETKERFLWPPGIVCNMCSPPSGQARLHLSEPYSISAAASFHKVRNVIKCKCPPCLCSILSHTFIVVGNGIAGFCYLDTVQPVMCVHA